MICPPSIFLYFYANALLMSEMSVLDKNGGALMEKGKKIKDKIDISLTDALWCTNHFP